jgi:hypothetical protein
MDDNFTYESIRTIKEAIERKTSDNPYFANNKSVLKVVTDMDHHPYTRWFRGVYNKSEPTVMEREAGWRQQENDCYGLVRPYTKEKEPSHCFEIPCTTTLPCYPEYLTKYADKDSLNVMINKACILQYR